MHQADSPHSQLPSALARNATRQASAAASRPPGPSRHVTRGARRAGRRRHVECVAALAVLHSECSFAAGEVGCYAEKKEAPLDNDKKLLNSGSEKCITQKTQTFWAQAKKSLQRGFQSPESRVQTPDFCKSRSSSRRLGRVRRLGRSLIIHTVQAATQRPRSQPINAFEKVQKQTAI
jgi:hypothetical protein